MSLKVALSALSFLSPLSSFSQYSQAKPQIVESCYGTAESDLNDLPVGTNLRVLIEKTPTGYIAHVQQVGVPTTLLEAQFPMDLEGDRSGVTWRYVNPTMGFLVVYRTNEGPRTPTTVNAHFRYFLPEGGKSALWGVDRLECQPIDLKDIAQIKKSQ